MSGHVSGRTRPHGLSGHVRTRTLPDTFLGVVNFMFFGCKNLNYIDLDTFNTENIRNMNYMFGDYSNELKTKIKIKYRNIKEEAFK